MNIKYKIQDGAGIKSAILQGCNSISYGSESCPRNIPNVSDLLEMKRRVEGKGIAFELLLPIVMEADFHDIYNKVVQYILECEETTRLAVNDWGILYRLNKDKLAEKCHISMGSGLVYTYEECPWYEHLLEQEKTQIKSKILTINYDSKWLFPLLKEKQIRSIEIPITTNTTESIRHFIENGISVNGLVDYMPVSISRACHVSRYLDKPCSEKVKHCKEAYKLNLSHRWVLLDNEIEPIRQETHALAKELLVYGNEVYVSNKADLNANMLSNVNTVVFDTRLYKSSELIERTNEVKKILIHKG